MDCLSAMGLDQLYQFLFAAGNSENHFLLNIYSVELSVSFSFYFFI